MGVDSTYFFKNQRLLKDQISLRKVTCNEKSRKNYFTRLPTIFLKKVSGDREKFEKLTMGKF